MRNYRCANPIGVDGCQNDIPRSNLGIVDDRIPDATRGVGATGGSPLRVSGLLSSTIIALPEFLSRLPGYLFIRGPALPVPRHLCRVSDTLKSRPKNDTYRNSRHECRGTSWAPSVPYLCRVPATIKTENQPTRFEEESKFVFTSRRVRSLPGAER